MLRFGQPHLLPCLPTVKATVDPIAPPDMATAHILARTNPDNRGIGRVNGDAANRIGGLIGKDRLPGGTGVCRFPYPTGTSRHIPGVRLSWVDGNIGNPPAHERRTNRTEL